MVLGSDSIIIFDGGMGTELYERGYYINRPFEELNLSAPSDVIAVHLDYLKAGAQVITTNTFSITRPQLKKFDIEGQQIPLVLAALKNANLARTQFDGSEANGTSATLSSSKIALSFGPLGVLVEPLGAFALSEVREEFAQLTRAVMTAAVKNPREAEFDLYSLETFTDLSELGAAIDGIRSVDTVRPILASLSVKSSQNEILAHFAKTIGARPDVQYLGLNCSEGPSDLLVSAQKLLPQIQKPLIVQPNAGTPRQVNGRYFYMTSPDYMAKYTKRFVEAGVAGVGGCCGTGPDHVRAIRSSVRMMNAKKAPHAAAASGIQVSAKSVAPAEKIARVSFKDRRASHLSSLLSKGKKIFSIEMLPPKGIETDKFFERLEQIAAAGIPLVNIPDGARAMTRVSSLHISVQVQNRMQGRLHAIPHFTTRDRNLIALQSDLLGAYVNGITDVLLLTGDPPKLGNNREATAVYDIDAIGLAYLADCLNRGVSPGGESLGKPTQFGIGVASNPTAINLEVEISRWEYKVESGADFAITQPIFDPDSFLRWKDQIAKTYRPHLVGIWPLLSLRNAEFMANEVAGVHVPAWVIAEMEKAGDNKEEALKRGMEIAQKVIARLSPECEGFCVSAPLGRAEVALQVFEK